MFQIPFTSIVKLPGNISFFSSFLFHAAAASPMSTRDFFYIKRARNILFSPRVVAKSEPVRSKSESEEKLKWKFCKLINCSESLSIISQANDGRFVRLPGQLDDISSSPFLNLFVCTLEAWCGATMSTKKKKISLLSLSFSPITSFQRFIIS